MAGSYRQGNERRVRQSKKSVRRGRACEASAAAVWLSVA
jgi:hypothetical protein